MWWLCDFANSLSFLPLCAVSGVMDVQEAFAVLNIKEKLHNIKQGPSFKRKVTVHHQDRQVFRLVDGTGPVHSVSWTASQTIRRLTSQHIYSVHYHEEAKWLKLPWLESQELDNLDRSSLQLLLQMSADVYYFSDISHWTIQGLDLFLNSSSGGAEKHRDLKTAAWTL